MTEKERVRIINKVRREKQTSVPVQMSGDTIVLTRSDTASGSGKVRFTFDAELATRKR